MRRQTRSHGAAILSGLALAGASAAEKTWTLKTDDTHLELTVRDSNARNL